jgi:hypothetical protein
MLSRCGRACVCGVRGRESFRKMYREGALDDRKVDVDAPVST